MPSAPLPALCLFPMGKGDDDPTSDQLGKGEFKRKICLPRGVSYGDGGPRIRVLRSSPPAPQNLTWLGWDLY